MNVLKVMVGKKRNKEMYVRFTEDTRPNAGGYYCEVFYDPDCKERYDEFTIQNTLLRGVDDKLKLACSVATNKVLNMFGIF